MSIISGNPELVLFVYFDLRLLQKTRHFLRCKTKTNRDMLKYLFTHFREFVLLSLPCVLNGFLSCFLCSDRK